MNRLWKRALAVLLVALAAELIAFNFRHWESLGYRRVELTEYDGVSVALDADGSALELAELDRVVENVYLDCVVVDENGEPLPWQALEVTWQGRDEANSLYFKMGKRELLATLPRMRYTRINLLGEARSLKLSFASEHVDAVAVLIRRVALNAPVPLFFSPIRFSAVAALLALALLLRPGSPVYRVSFEAPWRGRRAAVALTAAALCAVMCAFVYVDGTFADKQEAQTQYHYLARALAKGQVWLDIEPTQALLDMENPYDAKLRDKLVGEDGFMRDYAFYNGKYYCYFGALPAALAYLPWYLLTGRDMHASAAHMLFGATMTLGVCAMLHALFRARFRKAPFALYPLGCAAMLFCPGLYYAFRATKLYALPIVCAMALTAWGLCFWLRAAWLRTDGWRRYLNAAAGSLCVALTVLARPQFIFACVFVFPIFAREFAALLKGRIEWKLWLALLLPVLPVAAVTMLYNNARFGSPFDFGATYNLCSGDMRARGWRWDRLGLALYAYLVAPLVTSPVFPFLKHNAIATGYLGTTICENAEIYGGLFALMPGLSVCLTNFRRREPATDEDRMALRLARLCVPLALVILTLDAQVAGIVFRYRMDFGWLFALSALIWLLRVESDAGSPAWLVRGARIALALSVLVGFAFEFLALFTNDSVALWWHPRIYYGVKALMEFWL